MWCFLSWQFQLTSVRFLTEENKTNNAKNITLHLFSKQQFWMSLKWLLNDVTIDALKQAQILCAASTVGLISSGGGRIINCRLIVLVGSYCSAARGFGFGKQCISMAFIEGRLGKWQDRVCFATELFIVAGRASEPLTPKFLIVFPASLFHHCWERPHPTTLDLMSSKRSQKFLLPSRLLKGFWRNESVFSGLFSFHVPKLIRIGICVCCLGRVRG